MNKSKIPTILGITILLLGSVAGIIATQYKSIFRLGATADLAPQDVRITNISDSVITVNWVTDRPTIGAILWGETPSLGKTTTEEDQEPESIHTITLSPLLANANYYFKISSGGETFDNGGISWQTKTGPAITANQTSKVIAGSVLTQSGQPGAGLLVYLSGSTLSPLSTKTSPSGGFIIPVGNARNQSLSALSDLTNDNSLEIFVQGGASGITTAKITIKSSNPVPPMTIGQTYDFRNAIAQEDSNFPPEASLDLPTDSKTEEQTSSFKIPIKTTSPNQKNVTLKSTKEGEIVTTQKPQFFGDAPPNIKITVTVESDPVTETITADTGGSWKWNPPTTLEEGSHKLTVSWRDAQGILRTITRNFVVSAQEGPSFESSSSGTTTPKPSPSPTIKPTASPVASSTPSSSPRVSIPSTESAIPIAGHGTPAVLLSLVGMALLVFGIFLAKNSLN